MTTVLKLGGSVITKKDTRETVDEAALTTAAEIVGDRGHADGSEPGLVVVHGGGSFGHPTAAAHTVSSTEGSGDAAALLSIHRAMGRLNGRVVAALQAAGVAALPVRPLSLVHREAGAVTCPREPVDPMLSEGFTPVSHGDVVVHEGKGGTVLGGDRLVAALADALDADRIGVCSTVPGVLDGDGEVIPEIRGYETVADLVGDSASTDVTGGMAGKVRALLDAEPPAAIFGLDGLETFLETGRAGTTVR